MFFLAKGFFWEPWYRPFLKTTKKLKMLFSDDVDTINGMLAANGKDLKTDLCQVLDLVVETANGISKKRYNDVKQDEEAQHYLNCLKCLYTRGIPKLARKIDSAYFQNSNRGRNASYVMPVTSEDFPKMENRFDYEIVDLACALATYGYNVNVWSYSRVMLISKGLIEQKKVAEIAEIAEMNADDKDLFFVKKCQVQTQSFVNIKRRRLDGSEDGDDEHRPSWGPKTDDEEETFDEAISGLYSDSEDDSDEEPALFEFIETN